MIDSLNLRATQSCETILELVLRCLGFSFWNCLRSIVLLWSGIERCFCGTIVFQLRCKYSCVFFFLTWLIGWCFILILVVLWDTNTKVQFCPWLWLMFHVPCMLVLLHCLWFGHQNKITISKIKLQWCTKLQLYFGDCNFGIQISCLCATIIWLIWWNLICWT